MKLVSEKKMTGEIFFLKNHSENVVKQLASDPFLNAKLNISLDQHSEIAKSFF